MGNDARITGLSTAQEAEVASLIASLSIEIDDPNYINAESKQVLLSTLFSDRDVPDNTTVVHKAVTERGLMKTIATTTKKGITRYATDPEVENLAPHVALAPYDVPLALQIATADNYYDSGNAAAIYDHAFPSALSFAPTLSVTDIGNLVVISGGFIVVWSGVVSKFEIWLKCRVPLHKTSATVSVTDGTTLRACGATIETRNGFTVLTVHMTGALPIATAYVNVTYQGAV